MDGIGFIGVLLAVMVVLLVVAALGPFAFGLPMLYFVGIHPIVQGYRSTTNQ